MRAVRLWFVIGAAALAIPLTAATASANAGTASGTITQCPGYPVPPFQTLTRDGITFTIGNICHVYSGTVSGTVKGVQYTVILQDGSRLIAGQETLQGDVADRRGTAHIMFSGTRQCFPGCPATLHLWAADGTRGLTGLVLDITAVGAGVLTYTGTYSFGEEDEEGTE